MINTANFAAASGDCDEKVICNSVEHNIPTVKYEFDEDSCTVKPEPSFCDYLPNICDLDTKIKQEWELPWSDIKNDNESEIEIKPSVLEDPELYVNSEEHVQTAEGNDSKTTEGTVSYKGLLKELDVKLERCNFAVTHRSKFRRFQQSQKEEPYDCYKCSFRTTKKPSIRKHVLTQHEPPFENFRTCKECGYRTKLKHSWELHQKKHRASSNQKFRCAKCSFVAGTKCSLRDHLLGTHEAPFEDFKTCDKCGYKTKLKLCWIKHQVRHQAPGFPCEFCDKKFVSKLEHDGHLLDRHYTKDIGNLLSYSVYQCHLCSYKNIKKTLFTEHMRCRHPEEKEKYYCDYCGYETGVINYMKKHIRRHQREVKKYCCEVCGVGYRDRMALELHILNTHKDNEGLLRAIKREVFTCTYCDRKFFDQTRLDEHLRCKHVGYICDFCNKKHINKFLYHEHLVQQHFSKAVEEMATFKIFKCDKCDYRTTYPISYKGHVNGHVRPKKTTVKWRVCESCDFRAKNQLELNKHQYDHHSNKDLFKCEYCGNVYKLRISLENHYLAAHRDDPNISSQITMEILLCYLCDFKTVSKGNLERHLLYTEHK